MPRIAKMDKVMKMTKGPPWTPYPIGPLPFKLEGVHWPKKQYNKNTTVSVKYVGGRANPAVLPIKMAIFKGDKVQVLTGPDTGKLGKIREVAPVKNQLLVEGMNLKEMYMKDLGDGRPGYIQEEKPLHFREVKLVNPNTGLPCVAYMDDSSEEGSVRRCTATQEEISIPVIPHEKYKDLAKASEGDQDTKANIMSVQTYIPSLLFFHEEIMLEYGIPMSVPKTKPERRDLIFEELRREVESADEQHRLESAEGSGPGMLSRAYSSVTGLASKVFRK